MHCDIECWILRSYVVVVVAKFKCLTFLMHECDCGIFKLDDNRFEKKAGHDVKCGRSSWAS